MDEKEEFIINLLKDASAVLSKMQEDATSKNKNAHDLVTDADIAAEKLIMDRIEMKYPSHKIYSEEGSRREEDLLSDGCWIIDPLDGTNNYAYGFPIWGVSIAYAKNGEALAGGVCYPMQGIILAAIKGEGARKYEIDEITGRIGAGERIQVSKRGELERAMVLVCHAPQSKNAQENFETMGRMSKKVFNIRNLGAAVYNIGYVAMGLADVCVEFKITPHDGAAGALLVREAGGKVTDLQGKEWELNSPSLVCTNAMVHEKIIALLEGK